MSANANTTAILDSIQDRVNEMRRILEMPPEQEWTLPRQLPGFRELAEGEEWHFADKWKKEELPHGKRPLLKGEKECRGDEAILDSGEISPVEFDNETEPGSMELLRRTSRPLPLLTPAQVAEGWIEWHGGENPVPGKRVEVIGRNLPNNEDLSDNLYWQSRRWAGDIIAYRIIEPATRTVELGPEDVPPGSVFRPLSWGKVTGTYITVSSVRQLAVCMDCTDFNKDECDQSNGTAVSWHVLMGKWLINRSLSLGKWDPSAWQPCSKEVAV